MKLLFDENLSPHLVERLADVYPEMNIKFAQACPAKALGWAQSVVAKSCVGPSALGFLF